MSFVLNNNHMKYLTYVPLEVAVIAFQRLPVCVETMSCLYATDDAPTVMVVVVVVVAKGFVIFEPHIIVVVVVV